MLIRSETDRLIVITQPAHAALSGQLARVWGNTLAGSFVPRDEVCQAATLHDLGWLDWEAAPAWNPATRRPYGFMEMPLETHLAIFRQGAETTLRVGRYVALLTSLHGSTLYQRRLAGEKSEANQRQIADFLEQQRALQAKLLDSLAEDPHYAAVASPEVVRRNQRLVAVWDWLSLLLCGGLREPRTVPNVPAADGEIELRLQPVDGDGLTVSVTPWPFAPDSVALAVDGRVLAPELPDEPALRAALAAAPWHSLRFQLRPAID